MWIVEPSIYMNIILKIIFILVLILIMMNELRLYGGLVGRPHEYAPLNDSHTKGNSSWNQH